MKEIFMLRARWRELETEPRIRLNGHEGENPGYGQAGVLTGHRASSRPYNSAIYLNGKYYANSSELANAAYTLLLPPGEYTVKIVPVDGSKGREDKIKINANQTLVLTKGEADIHRK